MSEARYRDRRPVAALSTFVHSVWVQEIADGGSGYRQRVVPDGCVDALWLNGELRVAGPDTGWRMVPMRAGSFVAGVRLLPGAAPLLFGGVPVDEARDQELALTDLWSAPVVRALADRAGQAESPTAVARLLEDMLVARLPEAGAPDPMVPAVVAALDRPGACRLSWLADRLGVSERQLRRRVVAAVGYSPATLKGVLRLGRAMRLYESGRAVRAADVAHLAGYLDQPHLTREMRRLTGRTPGQVRAAAETSSPPRRASRGDAGPDEVTPGH